MRYRNHSIRTSAITAILAIGFAGCSEVLPGLNDIIRPGDPGTASTYAYKDGKLKATFETSGASTSTRCGDAAGVAMAISGKGGASQSCEAEFAPVTVSGDWADGATGDHQIADCIFVVSPGVWHIDSVEAIDAEAAALQCCTSSFDEAVLVSESETSEVGGLIQCETVQNGALDIYAVINTPPTIEKIDISPSKFGATCSVITLTAYASDPQGDVVTYRWEVVEAPEGAHYHLELGGDTAAFASSTVGDFQIRVIAADETGASHQLDFPLHIVEGASTVCEPESICPDLDGHDGDDGDDTDGGEDTDGGDDSDDGDSEGGVDGGLGDDSDDGEIDPDY